MGMTDCDLCAPGTFSDQSGASACSPCGLGHFSQTTGSPSCFGCPEGQVVFNSFPHSSYMFFQAVCFHMFAWCQECKWPKEVSVRATCGPSLHDYALENVV